MDPGSLLMLGLLVVIFYFMLIRPQQRRLKQHQALLASLAIGDEIVTIGGIHGVIRRLGEDEIVVEIAENTLVRFSRQAISKKKERKDGEEAEEAGEPAAEPADVPEVEPS